MRVGVWQYEADTAPAQPEGAAHQRKSTLSFSSTALHFSGRHIGFNEILSAALTEGPPGVGVLRVATAAEVLFFAFVPPRSVPDELGVPVTRAARPAGGSMVAVRALAALIVLGLVGVLYLITR